ncbi:MAG: CHRD domain-containing protein [Nitrospirae bacterium]|nr:CHRD domain-containing protein [Nitrospirota bacterium]
MKQLMMLIALVIMVFFLPSHSHAVPFTAILDGLSENPATSSLGTGFAKVDLDTTVHMLSVDITFSGLDSATTVAHIHCCVSAPLNAGVAVFFSGFPSGVTSGTYTNVFATNLASTFSGAFITVHGGTTAGAEAALLAGLLSGEAYVNIHTAQFPAGEIRGFLQSVPEPGTLILLSLGLCLIVVVSLKRGITA